MSTSTAALHTRPMQPQAGLPAWKTELNAKLEAHRQRRGLGSELLQERATTERREPDSHDRSSRAAAARVAAKVAERYAKAPSYSEVLAANAAAAAAAADMAVAAAVAAEAHQAAHQAAHDLFSDLAERELAREAAGVDEGASSAPDAVVAREMQAKVEHPYPLPARVSVPERAASVEAWKPGIADAFAEAEVSPAMQLPAKLIEFPRELVAARKSRPRIAEGPLAETPLSYDQEGDESAPEPAALRIFEVQDGPAQPQAELSRADASRSRLEEYSRGREREDGQESAEGSRAPQWQSIRLGEHPSSDPASSQEQMLRHRSRQPEVQAAMPLHVASLGDRGMAALVDFAVAAAAFLLFVLVFASCTAHPPLDKIAFASAGVIFVAFLVFYQWLFLSYGGETLGMRYAQIALCTFDDENPTRPMLRRRLWASLLAALPLGLGLVWAVFDEDALGWHDRMSRTYQRSYR